MEIVEKMTACSYSFDLRRVRSVAKIEDINMDVSITSIKSNKNGADSHPLVQF